MSYRSPYGYAGEPIQQSMYIPAQDHPDLNFSRLELGIVLAVYPSDDLNNKSSQQRQDRRGFRHECTVQIVGNGHGGMYRIPHVVIPPNSPSGVDDYEEYLPRPCSTPMTGGELDLTMQRNTPHELDGDWCVVGFLNQSQSQPFILRWWPNPNNVYDPQTSGQGSPDRSGNGKALNQTGRYFRRLRGIETTITPAGDFYFDTNLAGAALQPSEPISKGRFKRADTTTGGNVRASIKNGAHLEIDWTPPKDGIGILDQADAYLPQSNPKPSGSNTQQEERQNTYLKVNKDVLELLCPSNIKFNSERIEFSAKTEFSCQAPNISLGKSGADVTILGDDVKLGDEGAQAIVTTIGEDANFQALLNAAVFTPPATPAPSAPWATDVAANAAVISLIQEFLTLLDRAIKTKAA